MKIRSSQNQNAKFILFILLTVFLGCSPGNTDIANTTEKTVSDSPDLNPPKVKSNQSIEPEDRESKDGNLKDGKPIGSLATGTEADLQVQSDSKNSQSTISDNEANGRVDHDDPTSYPVTQFDPIKTGQIAVLSWNVESDGADPKVVCRELKKLNSNNRYDIVALTEVLPPNLGDFRNQLGKHYKYAYSKSGRSDRLQILYNEDKYKKIRHFEIQEINIQQRYRAPLVVHLKKRNSGLEFLVMVNHLARGKSEIRQQQATMLVDWARDQTLPLIALGDYNFDFVFDTQAGNQSFKNFMRDNIFNCVQPEAWVDSNWYDNPESPDGKDDYPGSMLDFAFVAGPAKQWESRCQIIVRAGDFPDDRTRSDHRPYELITLPK
ncbi:MAG: endonuclease/exonuclease/phosphatase family protein [Planctomycetota bacterium]